MGYGYKRPFPSVRRFKNQRTCPCCKITFTIENANRKYCDECKDANYKKRY